MNFSKKNLNYINRNKNNKYKEKLKIEKFKNREINKTEE